MALARFVLLFILLFVALQRLYIMTRPATEHFINHRMNARVSAWIANFLTPGSKVAAVDSVLTSELGSVDISKGCEGVEVAIILAAAMLAYPMAWRYRLLGIVTGTLFVYMVNLFRILGLYFVISFRSDWFDTAHLGVGQTVIIILAVLYFMGWIEWMSARSAPDSPMKLDSPKHG
jgi:exosortase family protein XrtM